MTTSIRNPSFNFQPILAIFGRTYSKLFEIIRMKIYIDIKMHCNYWKNDLQSKQLNKNQQTEEIVATFLSNKEKK